MCQNLDSWSGGYADLPSKLLAKLREGFSALVITWSWNFKAECAFYPAWPLGLGGRREVRKEAASHRLCSQVPNLPPCLLPWAPEVTVWLWASGFSILIYKVGKIMTPTSGLSWRLSEPVDRKHIVTSNTLDVPSTQEVSHPCLRLLLLSIIVVAVWPNGWTFKAGEFLTLLFLLGAWRHYTFRPTPRVNTFPHLYPLSTSFPNIFYWFIWFTY